MDDLGVSLFLETPHIFYALPFLQAFRISYVLDHFAVFFPPGVSARSSSEPHDEADPEEVAPSSTWANMESCDILNAGVFHQIRMNMYKDIRFKSSIFSW